MHSAQIDSSEINPMNENLDRIPNILYKFKSFDKSGRSLRLACNGEAHFANAMDFNDPFDNYFIPTTKLTEIEGDELIKYLSKKAKQHFPEAEEQNISDLIQIGIKKRQLLLDGDTKAWESVLNEQRNNFGIFSLTVNPKSLPMWAYYGDSHQGMCIGLRSSVISQNQLDLLQQDELLMLHKVHYTNKIPKISIDIGEGGMSEEERHELETPLYTKSNHWEHEEEYRLIFYKHSSQNYAFGSDAVEEILVGLRVSDENIDILFKHLHAAGSDAVVKRAEKSHSEYKLYFEEI